MLQLFLASSRFLVALVQGVVLIRAACAVISLLCLLAGLGAASHYPIAQPVPIAAVVLWALLSYYRPAMNLVAIPAMLPLIGLYPWTGWLTFEEFDLIVLAFLAGAYARIALENPPRLVHSWWVMLPIGLMLVSVLISTFRGFADAGGFVFGWFQGYEGPMNSLRIGKSFFWAAMFAPLLAWLDDRDPQGTSRLLALGLSAGCLGVSLAAIWERLAFTGLLNFSADYRSSALFWEMHVGGAAVDGWLLLTIPFVISMLLSAKTWLETAVMSLLLVVAGYAALTTFSRGVYLGLLVSVGILGWFLRGHWRAHFLPAESKSWSGLKQLFALLVLSGLAGAAFVSAGYRGLLALLGIAALGLLAPMLSAWLPRGQILLAGAIGVVVGIFLSVLSNFLPKGPYWVYGLLWLGGMLAIHPLVGEPARRAAFVGVVAFFASLVAAANVAGHWGGVEALPVFSGVVSLLALLYLWGAFSQGQRWPVDFRWQAALMLQSALLSGLLAIFLGGTYMSERFSTVERDWQGRLGHWSRALGLLNSPTDLLLGKGLGRFPANYYFAEPNGAFHGTYRIEHEAQNGMLSLTGARHSMSSGDILRLSQRLGFNERGPFAVDLRIRAKTDVDIYAEVCEKHLLYPAACVFGETSLKANDGRWERMNINFPQQALPDDSWGLPIFKTFSIGIANKSGRADLDDIRLLARNGQNVLENGEFSSESAHWFFTSDRDHLPWHAKSLLVNVIFDQGIVGLCAFLLLTATALWKAVQGMRRSDEMAPYWLAGLLGFLVVGVFDSLTDVPRLAFLYYLVVIYLLVHRSRLPQCVQKVRVSKVAAA